MLTLLCRRPFTLFQLNLEVTLTTNQGFRDIGKMLHYNCCQVFKRSNLINKGELVEAITAKASIPKKTADATLTATIEAIIDAVAAGDKVTLVGLGSFESRERQAREGSNPQTGKTIKIPTTIVPAFSAGKLFKERVSSSKKGNKSK